MVGQLPGFMQPSGFTQICRSAQSREDIHDNMLCATLINIRGSTKSAESNNLQIVLSPQSNFLIVLIVCTGQTFEHSINIHAHGYTHQFAKSRMERKAGNGIKEVQEKSADNSSQLGGGGDDSPVLFLLLRGLQTIDSFGVDLLIS